MRVYGTTRKCNLVSYTGFFIYDPFFEINSSKGTQRQIIRRNHLSAYRLVKVSSSRVSRVTKTQKSQNCDNDTIKSIRYPKSVSVVQGYPLGLGLKVRVSEAGL